MGLIVDTDTIKYNCAVVEDDWISVEYSPAINTSPGTIDFQISEEGKTRSAMLTLSDALDLSIRLQKLVEKHSSTEQDKPQA